MNLPPWGRPDEGLERTLTLLEEEDWEKNVDGLTALFRNLILSLKIKNIAGQSFSKISPMAS